MMNLTIQIFQTRKINQCLGACLISALFFGASVATAQETWQARWAKLVEGAKKEGKVIVSGPPGPFQREAIVEGWKKAFPDIRLEWTGARGTQILARVVREREAGIYAWDIILASTDPTVFLLPPIKALLPLRDALVDPDVFDDAKWHGGFNEGFVDAEKKYFYSPMGLAGMNLGFVNRACIGREIFNKLDDMKRPELKGKVVWLDPMLPSSGSRSTWRLTVDKGEDWLRDLFRNQDVVFSRDYRQIAEWIVSCRKPVGVGIPDDVLSQMQKQGLGKQVEEMFGTPWFGNHGNGWAGGNENIGIYDRAPNPNAAKLFVNWYLSRDGQQTYANLNKNNSRRLDTKPADPNPNNALKPGVKYSAWGDEASIVKLRTMQKSIEQWGVLK